MGLELAEQLGWEVPDVIFYPTGGGTGLIGMWKAFAELEAIGFIGSKRPRMVAVQASMDQASRGAPLSWLAVDRESFSGRMLERPTRPNIPIAAQEQLVVELYSK